MKHPEKSFEGPMIHAEFSNRLSYMPSLATAIYD